MIGGTKKIFISKTSEHIEGSTFVSANPRRALEHLQKNTTTSEAFHLVVLPRNVLVGAVELCQTCMKGEQGMD
jgi:hypothetical protein